MNWKKLLLIAVVAMGFAFTAVPRSEARTFVSVGLGFPISFGYPAYGYPAYPAYYPYSYGYPAYYPYAYPSFSIHYYSGRPFYWFHGRRVFIARRFR